VTSVDMARFWSHPGANYLVNVDEVGYAWAEDVPQSLGGAATTRTYLTFVLRDGNSVRNTYASREQRDTAFRMFREFVSTGVVAHEPRLLRHATPGEKTVLLVAGCTCGWQIPDQGDPEDALALHMATAKTAKTTA
jgi:hypothetical protein